MEGEGTASATVSAGAAPEAAPFGGAERSPRVGLVYNATMLKHRNEFFPHPEQPARIERIHAQLEAEGLLAR